MPDWRIGTMGFSYADWAGVFYPPGTKAGDYLEHYAQYFDTVELDTTFHAAPPPERFRRWAEVTPDGFRFCMKMPRAVTHDILKPADPTRPPYRTAKDMLIGLKDLERNLRGEPAPV